MRVLIVNAILVGDENATGITMLNMLPKSDDIKYMQYCIEWNEENHCINEKTIFLNKNDVLVDKAINIIRRNGNEAGNKSEPTTAIQKYNVINDFLRGMKDISFCRLSKINKNKIREFNPDIIYTMGGNIRVLNQSIKLSKKLDIPIVFHCMDNWRNVFYSKCGLVKPFNKILKNRLKTINKRSVVNLGICEKMAKVYEKDYKKPYSYASNCVFEFNEEEYIPQENKMLIIFSGGLHFGRANTLLKLAEKVEEANKRGYNIYLEIYAPSNQVKMYNKLFRFSYSKILSYVEKDKQMENLKRADVLLHVESEDSNEIKYMNLSFSTKLVEYFAAGRTVLGYGPKFMASLDYIINNNCGYVSENYAEFIDTIIELYNNKETRKVFARNAIMVAKTNHNQSVIQKRIAEVFRQSKEEWGKIR